MKKKSLPTFRRYTDLLALIDILKNKKITFLPPSSWDDRNDRYLMDVYKQVKGLKTLLALCFSQQRSEKSHHWRVFAPGNAGVSIEFNRDVLLNPLKEEDGFRYSCVHYKRKEDLDRSKIPDDDLPFIKRCAYQDEKEFRILFSSKEHFSESDTSGQAGGLENHGPLKAVVNQWPPKRWRP
ncbi:MAG: DUF2971 domain-containing protein [Syntrophobacteraceae bacterium]